MNLRHSYPKLPVVNHLTTAPNRFYTIGEAENAFVLLHYSDVYKFETVASDAVLYGLWTLS
jgi:hypothetical protein